MVYISKQTDAELCGVVSGTTRKVGIATVAVESTCIVVHKEEMVMKYVLVLPRFPCREQNPPGG